MQTTRLGKIFGITIQLHFSWYLIFAVLAWSLATSYFPFYLPHLSTTTYWLMALTAAFFLFVSVLLHELSHSYVARFNGIKVEFITLFFFGGVASIHDEKIKPLVELLMALAGPAFSFLFAFMFYFLTFVSNAFIAGVATYLFHLNLIIACFNLIPGYPLDGGRALRALLYWKTKDLRKSTHIAATGGKVVAGILMVLGALGLVSGTPGGLWFILIGGFLFIVAKASYQQVVVKVMLDRVPLKSLIQKKIPTVSAKKKASSFFTTVPTHQVYLVKGSKFQGILDLIQLQPLKKIVQQRITVKQLAQPTTKYPTLSQNASSYAAYMLFAAQSVSVVQVQKKKKIIGYVLKSTLDKRLQHEVKFGQ